MKNPICSECSIACKHGIVLLFFALGLIFLSGCAGEIIKGEADQARKRETEMARLLEESRKHAAAQDEKNAELIRGQALLKRQTQSDLEDLSRANAELIAENRSLKARNEELFKISNSAELQMEAQNASFSKKPLFEIIPNNSLSVNDFSLNGVKIPPPRRLGENIVLEFSDSLLFIRALERSPVETLNEIYNDGSDRNNMNISNNVRQEIRSVTFVHSKVTLSGHPAVSDPSTVGGLSAIGDKLYLSPEGKEALRQAALEVRRNYPRNIYRLEGHVDKPESETGAFAPLDRAPSWEKIRLVALFLVRETGIPAEQIELCACGDSRPVVENNTPENRQRNRRIEWVIRPERKN